MKSIFSLKMLGLLLAFTTAWSALGITLTRKHSTKQVLQSREVAGEVLVKFKSSSALSTRRARIAGMGGSHVASLNTRGLERVKIASGRNVRATVEELQSDPDVEFAQPNYIYRKTAVPNNTLFNRQWGLKNTGQTVPSSPHPTNNPGTAGADMNMEKAWDIATDCSKVIVAVLDSGVNYNQEQLKGNMWNGGTDYPNHGYDFVDSDKDPMDFNGHGTHVAGIIGAMGNNGKGASGVCWKASIMALRAMDATGAGTTADIVQALSFAASKGAKIVNMSIGGGPQGDAQDLAYKTAIDTLDKAGIIVIAAAGNSGTDNDDPKQPIFPCNFEFKNLLCIGALDQKYELAPFSNFGAKHVHMAAPGANVFSLYAGAETYTSDNFNTGGTLNWQTAGAGWGYKMLTNEHILAIPANFDANVNMYANNVDAKVFKSFDLTGVTAVSLYFYASLNLKNGDVASVAYKNSAGDPFNGGVLYAEASNMHTGTNLEFVTVDLTGCMVANCSFGFSLKTNAADVDNGVAIAGFDIIKLSVNPNSYATLNGTSMAAPHVAGLAALVWSANPDYSAGDVIDAIKNGGRTVSALSSKTTTGKAADALGALSYIQKPAIASIKQD